MNKWILIVSILKKKNQLIHLIKIQTIVYALCMTCRASNYQTMSDFDVYISMSSHIQKHFKQGWAIIWGLNYLNNSIFSSGFEY